MHTSLLYLCQGDNPQQVFEMIGKRPQTKPCQAISGIVAEGEETVEDFGESVAIDTGLVAAAKRSNIMRWRATAPSCVGRSAQQAESRALLNESLREEIRRKSS
jgi:ferritin-like metal-binding protein YciE